jgi:hypothetical protein
MLSAHYETYLLTVHKSFSHLVGLCHTLLQCHITVPTSCMIFQVYTEYRKPLFVEEAQTERPISHPGDITYN